MKLLRTDKRLIDKGSYYLIDGDLHADGDLSLTDLDKSLVVKGVIQAGGKIRVKGNITAGYGILARDDIESLKGGISAQKSIESMEGYIDAENDIVSYEGDIRAPNETVRSSNEVVLTPNGKIVQQEGGGGIDK